jgi:hypothetical protein
VQARYEIRSGKQPGSNVVFRGGREIGTASDPEADVLVAKHPDIEDLRKGETMATATPSNRESEEAPARCVLPRFEALTKSLRGGGLSTTRTDLCAHGQRVMVRESWQAMSQESWQTEERWSSSRGSNGASSRCPMVRGRTAGRRAVDAGWREKP